MVYDLKMVSVVGVLCVIIGSRGVIRVLARAFDGFRGVTTEATAAFRADDGRESLRFNWRESVNKFKKAHTIGIGTVIGKIRCRMAIAIKNTGKRGIITGAYSHRSN